MVSEFERLNTVISTLEEQSIKTVQFNGVIQKLESLKDEISNSSEDIKNTHSAQKHFTSYVTSKIEENGNKTSELQVKLAKYHIEQASAELINQQFNKVKHDMLKIESRIGNLESNFEKKLQYEIKNMSLTIEQQNLEIFTYLKYMLSAWLLILIGLAISFF